MSIEVEQPLSSASSPDRVDTLEPAPLWRRRLLRNQLRRPATTIGLNPHNLRWWRFSGYAVLAILALTVAILFAWWYRHDSNVLTEHIGLELGAPTMIQSGDQVTYALRVNNLSPVDWQAVEVTLNAPRDFEFKTSSARIENDGRQMVWLIGQLPRGEARALEISGLLWDAPEASVHAVAEVVLTPTNFPSGRFARSVTVSTRVTGSSLSLGVDGPLEVSGDELVALTITVRNSSSQELKPVYIAVEPQAGLGLALQDETFSAGFSGTRHLWELVVPPGGSVTRTAVIRQEGEGDLTRLIHVETGLLKGERLLRQAADDWTLQSAPLPVNQ